MWPIAEKKLRKEEKATDTEKTFQQRALRMVESYGNPKQLIPSMARRVQQVILKKGRMTKY